MKIDLPQVYSQKEPCSIARARRSFRLAFEQDPEFRDTYVANAACILMDELNIQDKIVRDRVADRLIKHLFES